VGYCAGAVGAMMLASNRLRIMVATKPIYFRKGHDSLAALARQELLAIHSPALRLSSARARRTG